MNTRYVAEFDPGLKVCPGLRYEYSVCLRARAQLENALRSVLCSPFLMFLPPLQSSSFVRFVSVRLKFLSVLARSLTKRDAPCRSGRRRQASGKTGEGGLKVGLK